MKTKKGIAVLVGLTHINPDTHDGEDGKNGCQGCRKDVEHLAAILKSQGFTPHPLLDEAATKSNVLKSLSSASKECENGDIFVFFYSGHGGQVKDISGDEIDQLDETLITYDVDVIDDELNDIWLNFKPGVRILMLSDSCHSGSVYKGLKDGSISMPKPFFDKSTISDMKAEMLFFGGCHDRERSYGDENGGVFTNSLSRVWNEGRFSGNYEKFFNQIKIMAENDDMQHPEYHEYGPVNDSFRNQRPFSL